MNKDKRSLIITLAAVTVIILCGLTAAIRMGTSAPTYDGRDVDVIGLYEDPSSYDNSSADGIAADSRTAASFRTYENDDGWLVYYDKDLFTIEEKWNSVEFIYGDSEDDADKLIVRYIEDDSTEDVLEDLERGYDSAEIERSEGYMGGSREDWSFTISVPAKDEEEGVRKVYTVSEHNGGVLVAERTSSGENADEREKAIEGIVDTFLFTDHAPQIEYEEIPGRYVLNDF